MPYWLKRHLKKYYFFNRRFRIAIFVSGKLFLPNFKPYSNRPFVLKSVVKNQGGLMGDFFELFGL
jgi:hypothetical protein